MTPAVARGRETGIAALAAMQAADGSFPFFAFRRGGPLKPAGPLFATAYVMLDAGRLLPPAHAARAVDYIRAQRRPDRLWEYDPALGIPPDADSTACSLAVMARHGALDDPAAEAVLLRGFWRSPDGPFQTWVAPGMWSIPARDDAVVNFNIAHALGCLGAPPTPAERVAVVALARRSTGGSRYYAQPATILHAAHRAGFGFDDVPPIAATPPPPQDFLAAAQWLGGGGHDDALVAAVLGAQRADGSWPIAPWVTGVGVPHWGSAAISTGLAVESLAAL